jgi:hypothetical protein
MEATEELEAPGRAKARAAAVAERPPAASDLVMGRYRLGERLGSGGFGTVFAAHDERLDRPVAVKVIPADGRAPERAQREALAVARLDHPGIVALYDAGEEDGARYVVSELVRGRTLAKLEADGELSDRDVVRIGLALADALAHAHERGVVHRDVKPQNVIVPDRPLSGRGAAKLTDFGVAHLADEALTGTGDVVGTLAYMAPEQAAGEPVDDRTDLYSLALVLYEALAGANPVRAGNPAATARRLGKVLRPLGRARADLPEELCDAVDRALLPDPNRRGELEDLAEALAGALPELEDDGGLIAPHPLERAWGGPIPPVLLRLAAGAAAGGLVTAALLAFAPALPVPPAAAGAAAMALVAAFPRAGWLAVAVVTPLALLVDPPAERGVALLIAVGAVAPPLLLRRDGLAWSLPAAAPVLGLIGLAGAFPVLAACAGSARPAADDTSSHPPLASPAATRAGLAAAAAWWLMLAEPLLERKLLLGAPAGVPPLERFETNAGLTVNEVLDPLFTGRTLALAAIWAAAAVVMPRLLRTAPLPLAALALTAWAGVLTAATGALAAHVGAGVPYGLIPGGLAAAGLALGAWWREPAIIRQWE